MTHTPSFLLLKNRLYLYDGVSFHRRKIFSDFLFSYLEALLLLFFFLKKAKRIVGMRGRNEAERGWFGLCLKKTKKYNKAI
jgi:hypothetical protein